MIHTDFDVTYAPVVDIDKVDRQIVHALQVDGRATFGRIASVLGVSDQTVARRYRRMRTTGVVRVVGQVSWARTGQIRWHIRLRCRPGNALAIAQALAKRDDTSYIQLLSGGTEVVCVLQVRSAADRDALLLDRLPRTPQVEEVTAQALLHMYYGGPSQPPTLAAPLTPEQVARLTPSHPEPTAERVDLTEQDLALAAALAHEGRASHAELAKATGWSESAVRRRMAYLLSERALFIDVDVAEQATEYRVPARLLLSVAPEWLDATGQALAEHPEVAFAATTTGSTNLVAAVVCRDPAGLHAYITNRLAGLRGIHAIETAPVIRTVKGAATIF